MTIKSKTTSPLASSSGSQLSWASVLPSLPSEPGVYWFLNEKNKVLYVGKAKNLKNRVISYSRLSQLIGKTKKLSRTASKLKHKTTDAEVDALILEAELIKIHQPKFNIQLKDDKSPLYIYVTSDEVPQIKTLRLNQLTRGLKKTRLFGPFHSGYAAKKILIFIRKSLGFCSATPAQLKKGSPCFYAHLGQCPGVCSQTISSKEYQKHIHQIINFLSGKKQKVITSLKKKIQALTLEKKFEQAAIIRDQITILKTKTANNNIDLSIPLLTQDIGEEKTKYLRRILRKFISLPSSYPLDRIEGYDISNTGGTKSTGSMVVFINGFASNRHYKRFKIKTLKGPNDPGMIGEVISRRMNHREWGTPNLIVIDGGKTQLNAAIKNSKWNMPVVSIVKNPDRLLIKSQKNFYAIPLSSDPGSQLIRAIRDESHRFAKNYHKKLRSNFDLVD